MRKRLSPLTTTMSSRSLLLVEAVVIIVSILLSLYLQGLYDSSRMTERKEDLLQSLATVIEQDMAQIEYFSQIQNRSHRSAELLLDSDLDVTLDSVYWHLSSVGMGLRSFFPQRSPFEEIIDAQVTRHIHSTDLRTDLFKLFSEDLERHEVHTKEYDQLFLTFNRYLSENYLLVDWWREGLGTLPEIDITSFDTSMNPQGDRKLRGMLIESLFATSSYASELAYLRAKYSELQNLIAMELNQNV